MAYFMSILLNCTTSFILTLGRRSQSHDFKRTPSSNPNLSLQNHNIAPYILKFLIMLSHIF